MASFRCWAGLISDSPIASSAADDLVQTSCIMRLALLLYAALELIVSKLLPCRWHLPRVQKTLQQAHTPWPFLFQTTPLSLWSVPCIFLAFFMERNPYTVSSHGHSWPLLTRSNTGLLIQIHSPHQSTVSSSIQISPYSTPWSLMLPSLVVSPANGAGPLTLKAY